MRLIILFGKPKKVLITGKKGNDRGMSTIIEVMLAIRERNPVFYHKDTKQFDRISCVFM